MHLFCRIEARQRQMSVQDTDSLNDREAGRNDLRQWNEAAVQLVAGCECIPTQAVSFTNAPPGWMTFVYRPQMACSCLSIVVVGVWEQLPIPVAGRKGLV